jgi:hypothetical protein
MMSELSLGCSSKAISTIRGQTDGVESWKALLAHYEPISGEASIHHCSTFMSLTIKSDEDVRQFIAQLDDTVRNMHANGVDPPDKLVLSALVAALLRDSRYRADITLLRNVSAITTNTETLKAALFEHFIRDTHACAATTSLHYLHLVHSVKDSRNFVALCILCRSVRRQS